MVEHPPCKRKVVSSILTGGSQIDIRDDRPGGEVMRRLGTIVMKRADLETKFKDFVPKEYMADFNTAVIMNVTPRKTYGFALQNEVEDLPGFNEYLDCVRSLLNFYENSQSHRVMGQLDNQLQQSKDLTRRQETVLEMIKAHKTNANIANELGYSESLIRQETIIIYRKLGVSGRKDLVPEMPN